MCSLFNLLSLAVRLTAHGVVEMMSMSYQLEILWYQVSCSASIFRLGLHTFVQAERLRSLGWADYLAVDMSNDRKTLTISYWMYDAILLHSYHISHFPPAT